MKKVWAVLLAAALFLTGAAVFAEGAQEAEEPQIYAWADQGNVQLTRVGDCPDNVKNTFTDRPSGKLIMVEFTILDGAQMDSTIAFDFTKANVKLDDFEIWNIIAPGAAIVETADGGFAVALVGSIQVFFDVPADYDLGSAVLTVCGTEAFIPADPEAESSEP